MVMEDAVAKNIDEYIATFPLRTQRILQRIRQTIRKVAPDAEEIISYRMPAFRQNGIIVYFAAFKNHIGLYPPVSGDRRLEKEISRYAGPKGNLKFALDRPIPYELIRKVAKLRLKQNLTKATRKSKKGQ